MSMNGEVPKVRSSGKAMQGWTISKHTFSDLSHVSPVVFIYLLKECYSRGTCKASIKFRALQHQVHLVLNNGPQPGPAIFVAQCLYVLPILESHSEGFSHLLTSALQRFLKMGDTKEDLLNAKVFAAQLFFDTVRGTLVHDERILMKILEIFDVNLVNIEEVMHNYDPKNDSVVAKTFVEQYIYGLMESQSYMTAVSVMEQFSICYSGEPFLFKMMKSKQYNAAEKWATFMGKQMLCLLVQEYAKKNLLKHAYEVIKKNNLQGEFPEVYFKCKESKIKNLAEKGCWDIAEARTNNDRQLLEFLVYLAIEAGYTEKVEELCDRYSLQGFRNRKETEVGSMRDNYLHLSEFVIEDPIWVDEVSGLHDATNKIEECKVVGVDCEWKPTYLKGAKPSKVSIMQIASVNAVYIFDLIKLFEDAPDVLDNCLARILHSPKILKLGYNFQCDMKQLTCSYRELDCFKHYEMLLDIQNVFKEIRGGLSGLAKNFLGAGLNKTRRNSNWEQRPLSQNQLEYAALDAVVLVQVFRRVDDHPKPGDAFDGSIKWKSYIVSHMDNQKNSSKKTKKRTLRQ